MEFSQQTRYNKGKKYFDDLYKSGKLPTCSAGFLVGKCAKGGAAAHVYNKPILCNKEYCNDCGRDGSPAHQRRFNRLMPKIRPLKSIGYLVVPLPAELRTYFLEKSVLSDFRTALKNKLKRMNFSKGIMRWHYFGDCYFCTGNGCNECKGTGSGTIWKPHLNIILEGGYIDKLSASDFKIQILNFLRYYYKQHFNFISKEPVINYSYTKAKNNKIHIVKYVTRATFRLFNKDIATALFNYRTGTIWGKWKAKIQTDEALDNNKCLCCIMEGVNNVGINWQKFERGKIKNIDNLKHIKNGYYEKRIEKVNCTARVTLRKHAAGSGHDFGQYADINSTGDSAAVNNWREAAGF
jgi:hypothetical protein